jgi:hypothetical protein
VTGSDNVSAITATLKVALVFELSGVRATAEGMSVLLAAGTVAEEIAADGSVTVCVEDKPEEPQAMMESPSRVTKQVLRKNPANRRKDGILSGSLQ